MNQLPDSLTLPLPCLLCGKRPHMNGVWVPKGQALRLLGPLGKSVVRYSLCKKCCGRPDQIKAVIQAVEAKVLGDLVAEAGVN
jgi:hypothetical protein